MNDHFSKILIHKEGILLSIVLGLFSFILAFFFPFLNAILFGFMLGVLIGNFYNFNIKYKKGISFSATKMLEFSVVLLAFGISFHQIANLGIKHFLLLFFSIVIFVTVLFLSFKLFNLNKKLAYLIGIGTAICGSSAIAALAPNLELEDGGAEIGVALTVVNIFGMLGMVLFPYLLLEFHFPQQFISFFIGGSLHSVANVAGAGYAMGNEIGEIALTFKMIRVALLTPVLILFTIVVKRNEIKSWKDYFKFPWYLWTFFIIILISNFIQIPIEISKFFENAGKLVLTIAMAAIGLNVKFKSLLTSGKQGLAFGLYLFLVLISILCLMYFIFN